MDYNQGIPGRKLVNTPMSAFGSRAAHPFDLAGKGSVPMKSIFNLRPVFAAVLLVSSLAWTNNSFAQATSNNSSNDNKPVAAQPASTVPAPSTSVPAGSQSIPVRSEEHTS